MSLAEVDSIRKFYDGAEIFITGGSGFIGKVLVEKLLRSCPRIKTIYLLMRPKKGETSEERIQKMTSSMLFETLREIDSEAFNKLKAIAGDVLELNLGISESDKEKLKSCSIIFHAAASVRFDDPLKSAILLNTRGTREVCELAKSMPNLKSFVHVSTAYIQPKNFYVKEQIYPTDGDWRQYIDYAEKLDEDLLNILTLKLTSFAPNTYTYTKHLAEHVCIDYRKQFDLPITIFRPSIVTMCEVEPISGWCDTLNGPMSLTMVGALGLVHTVPLRGHHHLDVVPVDICVKGMIVSAFKTWKDINALESANEIPVINAASIKLVTYDSLILEIDRLTQKRRSINSFGLPSVTFTMCPFYAGLIRVFRQILPAMIVDGILKLTGNKTKLLKIQRIIYNGERSLSYFYRHKFKFDNFNFIDLNLSIPDYEKDEFAVVEKVFSNAALYHLTFQQTLKVVFGETAEDEERARRRYPYVYFVTKLIHLAVIFTAFKLFHGIAMKFI